MQVDKGLRTAQQTDADDAATIGRVLAGEVNAFEGLLEKYQAHVFKVVGRNVPYEEISDTAQEVFIRAYRSLSAYKGSGSFKSWLTAIAVRTSYDFLRKHYRSKETPISHLTKHHGKTVEDLIAKQSGTAFENKAQNDDTREILGLALNQLSAEDRMIVDLVYLQGLTGIEAAKLLGWSVANVKVRSFRCRRKLKKIITGLMEA